MAAIISITCFTNANAQKSIIADTNVTIKIAYPPLTEKEGKGLQIPTPPTEHPRLFLIKKDIPVLKDKLKNPFFKDCRELIIQAADFSTDGLLKRDALRQNNDNKVRDAIEAKALLYVLENDVVYGKQAVAALLNYYATLMLDATIADGTRERGRAVVTGAMVYDWCYPLLSSAEKEILIKRMETLAAGMEIKWPKLIQGSVTGHGTEAQLSRDMLSCGVATYNEKPEIYNRVAGRIFAEFIPARFFFYPASYHHQGSAYGPYRYFWDIWATLIFDKMGHPHIFGAEAAKGLYYFMYTRRPDGQLLRNGDDYNELFTPFGKYWKIGGHAFGYAGSYYKDAFLVNEIIREKQFAKGGDYLFDFLFLDDTNIKKVYKTSLPLTRYFKEPFGAMVARTGWDEGLHSNAVVAEMKVGVYNFVNHQHLDAGSFQLYYKGPLAVQSGIYQGTTGGYGSEHFKNYSQRTIAHNTMLFYDSSQKFLLHNKEVLNDGGQFYPNNGNEAKTLKDILEKNYKTGEVLAHAYGPDSSKPEYSYLKGEIAPAYGTKVKSFCRSFVFLNFGKSTTPAALIIFDRVITANKDFKKYWLLHCVQEPVIDGNHTVIQRTEKGYNGRMINTTLLPVAQNLIIEKLGGAGNEFSVFGKNFPQSLVNEDANSADSAMWRIEVSPKTPATNDLFLNVMQVRDVADTGRWMPVQKMETNFFTGLKIGDRIALFSKNGTPATDHVSLAITGNDTFKVLIVDVQEGTWKIEAKGQKQFAVQVNNQSKSLYFTGPAGVYKLSRIN